MLSLFSQYLTQTFLPPQLNNKSLKDFARCVLDKIEKNELNEISSSQVLSLLVTSQNTDYKKIQEVFTKFYDKIKDCMKGGYIPKLGDGSSLIDLDVILKDKFDWNNFMSCIMENIKDIDNSSFKKLIDYINEKKYIEAAREEFKLRKNGNEILKKCMPVKIASLLSKKE